MLCGMVVKEGGQKTTVLHWCQGEVKHVIRDQDLPSVMVHWNNTEEFWGGEKGGYKKQMLKDHLL